MLGVIFQLGARGGRYPYREIAQKYCTDYVLIVPSATAGEFINDPQLAQCRIVQVQNPADQHEIVSALRELGYLRDVATQNYFFPERDLYARTAYLLRSVHGDGISFCPPDKKALCELLSTHRFPQLKMVDVDIMSETSLVAAGFAVGFPSVLKPYNASACLGVIPVFFLKKNCLPRRAIARC